MTSVNMIFCRKCLIYTSDKTFENEQTFYKQNYQIRYVCMKFSVALVTICSHINFVYYETHIPIIIIQSKIIKHDAVTVFDVKLK